MRIGVAGWFGSDNLGDEVLLATTLRLVKELVPPSAVTVFAADPRRVAELHGATAVAMAPRGYGAKLAGTPSLARELRRLDVLLVGPGTVLQERAPDLRWPGTFPLFLRLCLLARLVSTPVVVFGAGVREDTTVFGRAALRVIGRSAAAIGMRDHVSAGLLGPRAQVIGDLAGAWAGPAASPDDPGRFAVSLRPLPLPLSSHVMAAVSDLIFTLNQDGLAGDFLVVAQGRQDPAQNDGTAWRAHFRDCLRKVEVPLDRAVHPGDPWMGVLASYRVIIAARLHAALLALHFATPTVVIAHEEKLSRTFADLGLSEFVWTPSMSRRDLIAMTLRALADGAPFVAAQQRLAGAGDQARHFLRASLAAAL